MKLYSTLLFICLILNCSMTLAQALSIRCNLNNQPVCYKNQEGKLKGMSIDMIKEAAKRSSIDINIELVPWKRLIQDLKTGETDGAMPLFKTKERKEFAYFIDTPLHLAVMRIYGKKIKR